MDYTPNPNRSIEEQFEPEEVGIIRGIQSDLRALNFRHGACSIYVTEIQQALEAGLLLSSLTLMTSFLELFIRDIMIVTDDSFISLVAASPAKRYRQRWIILADLRRFYEDSRPDWSFGKMLDELCRRQVIDESEVQELKSYYNKVRTPLHHGLTRRFVLGEREPGPKGKISTLMDALLLGTIGYSQDVDVFLNNNALYLLEQALAFVSKYRDLVAG